MTTRDRLLQLLTQKIVIMDGAMGTMIQRHRLEETDYRGHRFADFHIEVKGNNDLLSLTQPHLIRGIHEQYLAAGAQIIETNTFNSQAISLADYEMQHLAYELNVASARIAREAVENATGNMQYAKDGLADETLAAPGSQYQNSKLRNPECFVAGAIGPMSKTLSLSPDVNRPGYRAVTFDEVAAAYYEQVRGLVDGGVDILLIETIFDTLNAKAAIYAIKQYFEDHPGQEELPVMISGTITDASGRTLSGQVLEAFYTSVMHANPVSIGLNCALGARQMRPYIQELSALAECAVSCYPNAGLPNAMGEYDETPEETAAIIADFAREGWVNIVGGCCGTTPDHIAAIAQAAQQYEARMAGETAMQDDRHLVAS